jgi:FKBP-type peptidyl-prolyl cis-trans isomerase
MNRIFLFFLLLFIKNAAFSAAPPDSLSNLTAYFERQNIQPQRAREGFYYDIRREGNGATPRPGSFVKIRYTGSLLNGKIFDQTTTPEKDDPFVFQTGFRQTVPGLEMAVAMLRPGGRGTFFVPNNLAYGKNAVGNAIPAGAALIFEVELVEIMNAESYDRWAEEKDERDRLEFEKKEAEQQKIDLDLLQKYAAEHQFSTQKLDNGVQILITKKGTGGFPQPGQKLTVEYEGRLLDDQIFQKTEKNKPFSFVLGQNKVIEGWEIAFPNFNEGTEGWILLPSKSGYGPLAIKEEGIDLPANSCLIFKVKVLSID